MKLQELLAEVKAEIENDDREMGKALLKEHLLEVREAKKVLLKLESDLEKLLYKDLDDVI